MLNFGELFIVCFITCAILSFPWWLRAGEWLGERYAAKRGGAQQPVPNELTSDDDDDS